MKELTRAEEEIMQILWSLQEGFVKNVVEKFPDPKPAYNTVSTIIRILEKKGWISHKDYGGSYMYFPMISKSDYTKSFLGSFVKDYFGNSYSGLVSFFAKEGDLSVAELEEIQNMLKDSDNSDSE